MNRTSPEGRDKRTHNHNEPRDDTAPDALTVRYDAQLQRCVVVRAQLADTGERKLKTREGEATHDRTR